MELDNRFNPGIQRPVSLIPVVEFQDFVLSMSWSPFRVTCAYLCSTVPQVEGVQLPENVVTRRCSPSAVPKSRACHRCWGIWSDVLLAS